MFVPVALSEEKGTAYLRVMVNGQLINSIVERVDDAYFEVKKTKYVSRYYVEQTVNILGAFNSHNGTKLSFDKTNLYANEKLKPLNKDCLDILHAGSLASRCLG